VQSVLSRFNTPVEFHSAENRLVPEEMGRSKCYSQKQQKHYIMIFSFHGGGMRGYGPLQDYTVSQPKTP
jgi:hypothetical protein